VDRLLPLFGSEQRHEVGAGVDAVVKGAQTGIWPGIDLIGLGTVEDRRQIHPSLDNQTIDRTVVSEELPAPGSDRIRFAIDGDVVGEIVEDVRQADDLAEETVDPHHITCEFIALRAQSCSHQTECGLAELLRSELETDAGVQLHELRVRPGLPFYGADIEAQSVEHFWRGRDEQSPNSSQHTDDSSLLTASATLRR